MSPTLEHRGPPGRLVIVDLHLVTNFLGYFSGFYKVEIELLQIGNNANGTWQALASLGIRSSREGGSLIRGIEGLNS